MGLYKYCLKCFREVDNCSCDDKPSLEFSYENPTYALPPGTVLGEHFIVGPHIARGGFGIIYLGFQTNIERRVAIKEYFPKKFAQRGENGAVNPKEGREKEFNLYREMFFNEGPVLGRINHPNVVSIYEFSKGNNTGYLIMEYLSGTTAGLRFVKDNPTIPIILGISLSIIKGIKAIHNAGFLYLDLKPQNICITDRGNIKILDLGNTRSKNYNYRKTPPALTPGFASPEQSEPKGQLDIKADIYSLGATIYALLTGNHPPTPKHRLQLIEKGLKDLPAFKSNLESGYEETEQIIRKCISLNTKERYNNLESISADIVDLIHNNRIHTETDPSIPHDIQIVEAENNIIMASVDSSEPPPPAKKTYGILKGLYRWFFLGNLSLLLFAIAFPLWQIQFAFVALLTITTIFIAARLITGIKPQTIWSLRGISGEYQGTLLDITNKIFLGRDGNHCNLVFSSTEISRIHLSLEPINKNTHLELKDLNSGMGVFVNEIKVPLDQPITVKEEDIIQLGKELFRVER
jgi:serine/threonine protein kinase